MNTKHAAVRAQKRGIPPLIIELLIRFGRHEHDHRGAEIIYFDKPARRRVATYAGPLIGKLSEHLDSYAVMSDGKVITAGARYNRISHN